jgi:hypothetical protein
MNNKLTNTDKINLIAVIFDIQQQYLIELNPEYRHSMKQLCNEGINVLNRLIRKFDKIHSKENQKYFGDTADKLREKIDFWVKSENNIK